MNKDFDCFDILNNRFSPSFGSPKPGMVLSPEVEVPVLFYEYSEREDGSLETEISEIGCSRFAVYKKTLPQAYGYNYVVCPITDSGEPKTIREEAGPNDIEQTRGRTLEESLANFEKYCKSWLEEYEEEPVESND